jgi:hypothetical protein
VVLLGASNLAWNWATVVEASRCAWGSPLDFLAAAGHGRSYGRHSTVLGRGLPGILECGLWKQLESAKPLPTAALVTDVGNDLVYGRDPDRIAEWVEQCVRRLQRHASQITITELPLEALGRMQPWRFIVLRSALFPKSRLTLDSALQQARELNQLLRELAVTHNLAVFQPRPDWFGWDPIHIRATCAKQAWQAIFSQWCDPSMTMTSSRLTFAQKFRVARCRHERYWLWRWRRQCSQPSVVLGDGSRISLY